MGNGPAWLAGGDRRPKLGSPSPPISSRPVRSMTALKTLLQPRTLLLLFLGVGALGLVAFFGAAMQPVDKPWDEARGDAPPLLSGEVAGFERADFPRPVPELLVEGEDGEPAYLPTLVGTGRVTLVNLWASWCAPCLEELPSLVALSEATGARVLPVAQERRSEAQDRALARAGVADALPVIADPQLGLSRFYAGGSAQLPLTVIYDAKGREAGRLPGAADWSSPEAVRLVEAVQAGEASVR